MILLVSLVFDATMNTGRFVRFVHRKDRHLREEKPISQLVSGTKDSHWPLKTVIKYSERLGFGGFGVAGWIDLQFTRRRSKVILRFVWFPLVIAGLLIVAKGLADRATEVGFIAEAIIAGAMLIGCVIVLRIEAEGQRKGFLRDLRRRLSWLAGSQAPAEEPRNGGGDAAAIGADHTAGAGSANEGHAGTTHSPATTEQIERPAGTQTPAEEPRSFGGGAALTGTDHTSAAGSANYGHGGPTYRPATKEQIALLIERTQALDEGAFASALNQPLVKAIFVPIGAGVWPLLAEQLGR
jgi:hypothetical protein